MPYFAVMLARTADGWVGHELDFDEVEDLEALVDLMRDAGEDDEPVLVLVEEDDEYVGTPGEQLLELCAEEGMLPADVIGVVCERAGCLDVLESLR